MSPGIYILLSLPQPRPAPSERTPEPPTQADPKCSHVRNSYRMCVIAIACTSVRFLGRHLCPSTPSPKPIAPPHTRRKGVAAGDRACSCLTDHMSPVW